MTRILAIGGAVVKTAWDELKEVCEKKYIDVLIHCGGSIFHDFQRATESLESHSYPLDLLLEDYECNRPASELVWKWIEYGVSPEGTVTNICQQNFINVMLFTVLGADFWQLFNNRWYYFGGRSQRDFSELCKIMTKDNFHFISMGSAVVMPEIFIKALAVAKPKHFRADVVDFIPEMYRPKTRVSKYGTYFCMTHKDFLSEWLRLGFLNGDPK
jgi:hypothetical protein